jgi:hypothetical protein
MDNEIYGERVMKVFCGECNEFHRTEEVKFLNIEEDYKGRDYMTFECHLTNTEQKAYVLG